MRYILLTLLISGCATDKVMHSQVGAGTYIVDHTCFIAGAAGIAKEIVDSRTHNPDALDAAATYFGCVGLRILF